MKTLEKLSRIPLALAVTGAYLNSAELLAEFQPDSRRWVGYLGALSVSIALFICVEAFLRHPSWVTGIAVIGFGITEISTQILHAALVRGDVVVMTDSLRWVMGYLSPSVVVIVGVAMGFIARYGFVDGQKEESSDADRLRESIVMLADVVGKRAAGGTGKVQRTRRRGPAPAGPAQLELIRVNGNGNGKE